MTSSSESLNCRIDWHPSRILAAALTLLGVLAAVSIGACLAVIAGSRASPFLYFQF